MEAIVTEGKMTDAQYLAAIEEMQRKIDSSFARMDEVDAQTAASMERTKSILDRIEQIQAGRKL